MRVLPFMLLLLILPGCGKSDKSKLAEEITPILWEAASDKMEQANRTFERCEYGLNDKNLRETDFSKISRVHSRAREFYDFSDSLRRQYFEQDEFPLPELVEKFNRACDSISAAVPDLKTTRFDYLKSEHRENLPLTVTVMTYDVAALELQIMDELVNRYWVTIIRDDFSRAPNP